jgi:hypothetical protein
MTLALQQLVGHARALANDGPCVESHKWITDGGRACPHSDDGETTWGCGGSQAVYVCERCGEQDYGYPGGPGHADCERGCRGY